MDHPSPAKRKKSQDELSGATASKKARKRVRYGLFARSNVRTHSPSIVYLVTLAESVTAVNKR